MLFLRCAGMSAIAVALGFAPARAQGPQVEGIGRGDRYTGAVWASRSPVVAQHGMVASEIPLASQIGLQVLKEGGNAVDAMIATNAATGLMEPVLNGIGGDCFVIIWDPKTRQLYGYNGSGPSAAGRDLARMRAEVRAAYAKLGRPPREHIPPVGSLPVTVPGTVDTWGAIHDRFGRLPLSEDLAMAVRYAREGFPVMELVADYWKGNMAAFARYQPMIEESANARATYLIDGHTPRQGEVFSNPDLGRTLELIGQGGRDAFYKGPIAHAIDAYFRRIGGDLRYEDFARFHGEWVTPVSVNYRGYDVYELPPNGQGFAVLEMLQLLKGFDLRGMGIGSADTLTAELEAKRLAFEDLARYYADPRFVHVPVAGLLSDRYANERRKLIHLDHANPAIGPGDPALMQGDTTCMAAADADGMMVSLIQSNYRGMGSGLVADHLGFMFQDRGELYSLKDGAANVYAPGKRPFHTIIPAFVLKDGRPFLAFTLMGGDMQPQGHVQILTNMIDFGLNVQEAGDAARWRHLGNAEPTGEPSEGIGTVQMESGFRAEVKQELAKRGYKVEAGDGNFGGYEAIQYDPVQRVYWGATEMRKDGEVVGY